MKTIYAILAVLFSTTTYAAEVNGAGATFPYPIYAKWADAYQKETGNKINYQSVGSGAGIKQIQAKTVTFGASDMPLSDADLDKHGLYQFPTVIGGNVVVVNVEGVDQGQMDLDGPTIANIFLGKIKKWNDPAISKLNPKMKLPDTSINVIRRSDGSGTTFIFTKYLTGVSKDWNDTIGAGTAVEWPVGVGAKGNDGVAGNVQQTKNSIGYVEYAYAKQNKLAYTSINGVLPSKTTFQSGSWPITAPTYIIMYKTPVNEADAKNAHDFFKWAYKNGDQMADELEYVPLSAEKKSEITRGWK
jgi:phosphate transport system substrate-binding protein